MRGPVKLGGTHVGVAIVADRLSRWASRTWPVCRRCPLSRPARPPIERRPAGGARGCKADHRRVRRRPPTTWPNPRHQDVRCVPIGFVRARPAPRPGHRRRGRTGGRSALPWPPARRRSRAASPTSSRSPRGEPARARAHPGSAPRAPAASHPRRPRPPRGRLARPRSRPRPGLGRGRPLNAAAKGLASGTDVLVMRDDAADGFLVITRSARARSTSSPPPRAAEAPRPRGRRHSESLRSRPVRRARVIAAASAPWARAT